MTDEELNAIEARAKAATRGPWASHVASNYCEADFIAHARSDIPALLSELRAARTALQADGWSLIDSAPIGKPVLLWKPSTKEQYIAARVHGAHGLGWCTPDGFEIFRATHWKDLDLPPQETVTSDA